MTRHSWSGLTYLLCVVGMVAVLAWVVAGGVVAFCLIIAAFYGNEARRSYLRAKGGRR